ncbi:MAG: LysR family transcriptional regulator [Bacteroidia bacterium]|nr:LysR family transcriptional regulator [Bacteroidia bacterium]
MTLTQLEYIIAVDNFRHFQLAAEKCFITQPTLSMQIQKLEEEQGITIFDRSKKPVEPTSAGRKFIEQARVVLNESEKLKEIVKNKRGVVEGEFKLGIIPTIIHDLLPLFLKDLVIEYPNIELIIEELQTEVILDKLKNGLLDGAILSTPLVEKGIKEITLYYEPFMAYVHPDHKFFDVEVIDPNELNMEEVLLLNRGHCFRNQVINLCSTKFGQRKDLDQPVKFESGNFETLKKLVDQGFGLTLLPYLLALDIKDPEIRARLKPFKVPSPRREISMVFTRVQLKKNIINAICEKVKQSVPKGLLTNDESMIVEPLLKPEVK